MSQKLSFNSCRGFGVEIELKGFQEGNAECPEGIHFIANLISKTLEEYVEIRDFGSTHWYKTDGYWVLKPDISCGIEVCSPILRGWYGLKQLCRIIDVLAEPLIKVDNSCSLHVHLDVSDLTYEEIGNVLRWWIKCEPIFFDSVPRSRKINRQCQFIGLEDWLECDSKFTAKELIDILGFHKYYSLNTCYLVSGARDTIEMRLGDHSFCKNSFFTKNWLKLILHFIEITRHKYVESLKWISLQEFLSIMGFDGRLSKGMEQVKNWFLARILVNSSVCPSWFFADRYSIIVTELSLICKDFDEKRALHPRNMRDAVYNKIYAR